MSIYDLMNADREAYREKMMHPIPQARVVEREVYILQKARGKTVLDIGATGPMHAAITDVARVCYGVDIIQKDELNYFQIDLDRTAHLPTIPDLDMIIAGEVIEHLSNAGHFLDLLYEHDCPILLTTPNAFSDTGYHSVKVDGIEQVNKEHVAYYSYKTLSVLVERHGFKMDDFCWYHGKPNTAEGMLCLLSKRTR